MRPFFCRFGKPAPFRRIPAMHSPHIAVTLRMKVQVLARFLAEENRSAFEELKASQEQESCRYEERRDNERPSRIAKEREAQATQIKKMLNLPRAPDLPPLDHGQLLTRAFRLADAKVERQDAGDRLRIVIRHLEQQQDFLTTTRAGQREQQSRQCPPRNAGRDFQR